MQAQPRLHHLKLSNPWWALVHDGTKSIEGRVNDAKKQMMCIGDHITFDDDLEQQSFTAEIIDRTVYPDFKSMILGSGLKNILPGVHSVEDGVAIYNSFPCYADLVQQHGAVAFHLKVVHK